MDKFKDRKNLPIVLDVGSNLNYSSVYFIFWTVVVLLQDVPRDPLPQVSMPVCSSLAHTGDAVSIPRWGHKPVAALSLLAPEKGSFCVILWRHPHGKGLGPPANNQGGAEGSRQELREWAWKWILQPQATFPKAAALVDSLTAACERPWAATTQLSCSWTPDLPKLGDDKGVLF